MAIIIPFPGITEPPANTTFACLRPTLANACLSHGQIDSALVEIEQILEPLHKSRAVVFELPDNLGLTPEQAATIEAAYQSSANQFASVYRDDIGFSVCIIAGLVARQFLEA